jgi:hypothetical protein
VQCASPTLTCPLRSNARCSQEAVLAAGHSAEVADHAGGTIRTFGSFRLGVNNRSGDIDLLILAPVYVSRENFFDTFAAKLKEHKVPRVTCVGCCALAVFTPFCPSTASGLAATSRFLSHSHPSLAASPTKRPLTIDLGGHILQEVEDLNLVPEAYVPAIKLEFMGIEMDLLFAQLTQTNVSEDIELMNVELLRNLDDKSVRSVLPHPPSECVPPLLDSESHGLACHRRSTDAA